MLWSSSRVAWARLTGGIVCTAIVCVTADFCAALGFRTPTVMEVVPAGRLMLLWSSVDERKLVAVFTPASCNWEAETKPEPFTVSTKLVPGAVCVTEPARDRWQRVEDLNAEGSRGSRFCNRCCANNDRVTGKNAEGGRVKARSGDGPSGAGAAGIAIDRPHNRAGQAIDQRDILSGAAKP